jgi:hemerythrin superfamily protein
MSQIQRDMDDARDVVAFLVAQHEQLKVLLNGVLGTGGDERQRNFDQAREMLARHETGEEMIVRPLTRKAANGDAVADARMAEENDAKEVLARLEKMDVDSEEFQRLFTSFRQAVLDHAEAEERDEFPLLRRTTDPDALAKARERVEQAEKMAPTHPHPSAKTTAANYVAGPFAAMLDRARDLLSGKSGHDAG